MQLAEPLSVSTPVLCRQDQGILVYKSDPQSAELRPKAALDLVWITGLDPVMFLEMISVGRQSWSLFS